MKPVAVIATVALLGAVAILSFGSAGVGRAIKGTLASAQQATRPEVAGQLAPTEPARVRVEQVASGLQVPWALAFAPDGRLFFTERPGRLRVMVDGQLLPAPVATFPVVATSESGLMGLAIDPDFQQNNFVYVMYSYRSGDEIRNRISRLKLDGNTAVEEVQILNNIPGATIHDGGRLRFGPAAKLFASTGDAATPALAQSLDSLAGKILRMNTDGTVPDDNPFPGSLVYTLGHRNPEGLAFQDGTGTLHIAEHGPAGNDEVNIIEPSRNYGWPAVSGSAGNPAYADPIAVYSPSVAPGGATFYDGDKIPQWKGNLLFGTLRGSHIHRLVLGGADGRQVVDEEWLFQDQFGRIRDIIQGPDGFLYFSTSNRDGRGRPTQADDRILRVVPE